MDDVIAAERSRTNWAGNVTYRASALARPTSVDELQQLVASTPRLTALGSRHSFNTIADTDAVQVSLSDLPPVLDIDTSRRVVRVAAGMTHSQVAAGLEARGWALGNLASLPHISTAGAVATGTHGSGVRNPSLAQGVVGLDVVRASGALEHVDASSPDGLLDAHRVGIGALGVVTAVELAIEPTFQVATTVHLDLPWDAVAAQFDQVMSDAYSVSMFTSFDDRGARQVWVKHRVDETAPTVDLVALGARSASGPVHPGENDPAGVTEQGGVPGPWSERLPHFRSSFTPSTGAEIQAEYLIPAVSAVAALEALRRWRRCSPRSSSPPRSAPSRPTPRGSRRRPVGSRSACTSRSVATPPPWPRQWPGSRTSSSRSTRGRTGARSQQPAPSGCTRRTRGCPTSPHSPVASTPRGGSGTRSWPASCPDAMDRCPAPPAVVRDTRVLSPCGTGRSGA
jgi:xylitol oxidase